ncbi:PilN domain-containing protein [Chitinibacteraceae bacterium HSL-7]
MIRINLLPHREQKRLARQRRYLATLAIVTGVAVATVVAGMLFLDARIENQNDRNQFLSDEIAKLDRDIAEIERLRAEKDALLARKQVVERLQANRSESVRIVDQLVRQTPEGVYLKELKQSNDRITLNGYAQSNARVSTLMRNLNDSEVFEQPLLVEVKAAQVGNLRLSEFTLSVKVSRQSDKTTETGAAKQAEVRS